MRRGKALMLAVVMLGPWPAQADALNETLARYASLSGFTCHFTQTLFFADGSDRRFQGGLAVLRPKRFSWHYTAPYEQWYVGDGERVWHYEPDLQQVEVAGDLAAVDPVIMRLLAGEIATEDVQVLAVKAGQRRYRLRLAEGPVVELGLTPDGLIDFVESTDALGNRNRMALRDWQLQAPPPAAFVFQVPAGVDVVHLQ